MAKGIDHGRRNFLTGGAAGTVPVRPPWSSEQSILDACTRCGACIEACPQRIIRAGSGGFPEIDFSIDECTFCGACARACPEPVFADARTTTAFDHVAAVAGRCFARNGIHCQSCGDACPETAIRFAPQLGGPPLPAVATARCTGCGACFAACPADAITLAQRCSETADA